MIGAGRGDLAMRWASIDGVLNQNLPFIARLLQGVQIEGD